MASLTGLRTLYRSCALSRVRALRSAPVVECVNPVAKPLDDRSNKELEDGLQQDEFGPRKTAFAKELLRRRSKDFGGGMASNRLSVKENLTREPVVVVLDDDASVRAALKELIESVGLEVRLYASAGAFLEVHIPDARAAWCLTCGYPK